ncbi:MAG: hypothetical protein WC284_16875 [Candidimonas sp.]
MNDDIKGNLKKAKRKLIQKIKKKFTPLFWDSGYRIGQIGQSRPLRIYALKEPIDFKGFRLEEFEGVAENGIMIDSYGGGLAVESFSSFPIEDLIKLDEWSEKNDLAKLSLKADKV